jgi:beta-glucosidase/6-phospho-beta-glucosidase/beta-galactosidase
LARRSLFKSFWQAGFECSTHILKTGKRLDLVHSTGHDIWAERDFARMKEIGMLTAREGLRWHLIETQPGKYDFSSELPILEAAQRQDIQIVWDLLHFGWPAGLDIFAPEWVERFADLASAFGRVLRKEMTETPFVAPVNEISFFSWAGGDTQYINPFAAGRGHELKRQLVRAAVQASDAIRAEIPNVRLVSPEPVIRIKGDPSRPEDVIAAAEYESSMFEAWDMLSGRVHPELGGKESCLDIIGVNYYDRNQWWNFGKTIYRNDPEYRPFREILSEVYARYRRPMFVSETGTENEDRPFWLAYIAEEVRAAIGAGVAMEGICLYPILNHPGWDDDRHCYNGLWDYPQPHGDREIYKPLEAELERQKGFEREYYESPNALSGTGSDLPVPPAMELCVSAAPALNEQVRPGASGILC